MSAPINASANATAAMMKVNAETAQVTSEISDHAAIRRRATKQRAIEEQKEAAEDRAEGGFASALLQVGAAVVGMLAGLLTAGVGAIPLAGGVAGYSLGATSLTALEAGAVAAGAGGLIQGGSALAGAVGENAASEHDVRASTLELESEDLAARKERTQQLAGELRRKNDEQAERMLQQSREYHAAKRRA